MILAAENVKKTYHLGRVRVPVLHDASISVAAGEWVAIVGSSGSGKSTLLHLLGGLDRADADSGPILFGGEDLRRFDAGRENRYRNRDVGFVFQFYHLLPELTVLENAMLPALVGLSRLRWMSERSALRKRTADLLATCGLSHRLGHRPAELSGGERQRVAIARALINEPKILLADEPTGNLDSKSSAAAISFLKELHAEGLSILLVTHDPSISAAAGRILHLKDGLLT